MKILRGLFAAGFVLLAACARPSVGTPIAAGGEVDGTLQAAAGGTGKNPAEPVSAAYALQGRRGEQYVVRLHSDAFDSYLSVRGPGALSLDNDDDPSGNGSHDARITLTFPQDGTAQIIVTSFQHNESGAYHLSVARADAAAVASNSNVLTPDHAITGTLEQGDEQLKTGEWVDTYPLQGQAGQQIDLRLSSDAFDPYLAITGPNGYSEFNDDDAAGGTHNAHLAVTLPVAGPYVLHVTSYQANEHGAYRLEMGVGAPVVSAGGIGLGQNMAGELISSDETLRSGEFNDRYHFTGQAGQRVRIDMHSDAVDSYLMLLAPSGTQEDNDDGETGHPDARIESVLTESGDYTIVATSYKPGETGAYTVSLQQGDAAATVAATNTTAHRVFALMVGISDYPGQQNDLPFTAEDARKLRETLSRDGVLGDGSVVLVDTQATRAGVRAAFQRVAAEAGPDDLFMFFYSGHGGQVRTAVSPTEPDGKNETIDLYDGAMSDDEMAQLFNQVHARTALLVLDSCFSGGFARDVVSHPGVMGLFSSEEDLTSAVADKFQAGGYLSHFIQTGLSGEADENRDRVITAGELSAYVRREFAEQANNVGSQTMEGEHNYQFPVVDRGGVDIDAPMLALR